MNRAILPALMFCLAFAPALGAQEKTALAIMMAVYQRPQPVDMSATLTMTLVDSKGKERPRSLDQRLASFGGVDKKIMVFQSPADVRGTSFMNWSYEEAGKGDDQWIYMPALKRVKRITSDGKGGSFMGSDFSYDDLGARHPSKDSHVILGSDTVAGEECWMIESKPKDPGDSYSRTVSWISKNRLVGFRRDYYDKKSALLKTLSVLETRTMGTYLMITKTEMHNVQANHRTRMEFTAIKLDTGIADEQFTERAMAKGL
ncbi:MAG: hypothetical protein A2Y38_18000 [Spirochaetes bacterium GWB1_59_5]|nr:MAG: hypothetical protein A2Y38_18000 [Spirochaetes bacterium GWB1_59_5]